MIKDITKEKIQLELGRGNESLKSAELNLREGLFDESVSSAYYAMFHSVKAVLLTLDQEPSTHHGVVTLFGMHFIKSGIIEREYSDLFVEAKDDREESDYNVTRKFTKSEAEITLAASKKMTARLADYLKQASFL